MKRSSELYGNKPYNVLVFYTVCVRGNYMILRACLGKHRNEGA